MLIEEDVTNGVYTILIAFLDAPQRPLPREQLLMATRGMMISLTAT